MAKKKKTAARTTAAQRTAKKVGKRTKRAKPGVKKTTRAKTTTSRRTTVKKKSPRKGTIEKKAAKISPAPTAKATRSSSGAEKTPYDVFLKHADHLRTLEGVKGVSIGPRYQGGKPTGETAIRLHVSSKAAKKKLKRNPDKYGLKASYDGVISDIVVSRFRPAASNLSMEDGTCIRGKELSGTLGTTVFIGSDFAPVWLTAAHVVSKSLSPPDHPVPIKLCSSGVIGSVPVGNYFRDEDLDAALIEPQGTLPDAPTTRSIVPLGDLDKTVVIMGALNKNKKGTVESAHYFGELTTGETVRDHFLVKPTEDKFAEEGDSGAIVFLGEDLQDLVGQLRAVDKATGQAVVTRLENVAGLAKGFIV